MIILGKSTSPSAVALAARLIESPLQLRWGGALAAGAVQGEVHLLNGLEQLQAFRAAGLPCPDFTTSYAEALQWCETGWVLGRNLVHTQGFDIIPHGPKHAWPRAKPGSRMRDYAEAFRRKDFWVKLVPASAEWRVHIMRSPASGTYYSIGMGAKHQVSTIPASVAQRPIVIRSRRLGYHLRHDLALPDGIRRAAKDACAALKYDFGAVDILQTAAGSPVLLEVNSCPALRDDYTLDRYAKALLKYYGQKTKRGDA